MKKNTFAIVTLILFLTLISAFKANAQKIDMSGTVGFDRFGAFVTLYAGRV